MKDEPAFAQLAVFVVWMPVIPTDLGPPATERLALLRGTNLEQYWDPRQVLSKHIVRSLLDDPKLARATLDRSTVEVELTEELIIWDMIALFPPGVEWSESFPEPRWWTAPILEGIPELKGQVATK